MLQTYTVYLYSFRIVSSWEHSALNSLTTKEVQAMTTKANVVHRSAIDGEFVTEAYAKKHPKTTVKESMPKPGKGVTGRGKGK